MALPLKQRYPDIPVTYEEGANEAAVRAIPYSIVYRTLE